MSADPINAIDAKTQRNNYTHSLNIDHNDSARGEFVEMRGERYYAIRHVDQLPPFFISVVSDSDHWQFISSNGGVTAGRVEPEQALFPYVTVDKVYDSVGDAGAKAIFKVLTSEGPAYWEPFNTEQDREQNVSRHLYKNTLGNKLCFEEINHDLNLVYRRSWLNSDAHGFVVHSELENALNTPATIELIDGLENIMPAAVSMDLQSGCSTLVDAYKWSELDEATGLAMYALYAGISDKPEPLESMRANTVFSLGLDSPKVLLSTQQLNAFKRGHPVHTESLKRGVRGAYYVNSRLTVEAGAAVNWMLVADVDASQTDVAALQYALAANQIDATAIDADVEKGTDKLARIIASVDGVQQAAEEEVTTHHYANVLFNTMRGGVFNKQYIIGIDDFVLHLEAFNASVAEKFKPELQQLPDEMTYFALSDWVNAQANDDLLRLFYEYLPLTFGRRHGDPSRPWNHFSIRIKDDDGEPLLSYQGNWRDIFQNWEALALSHPAFLINMIAKFVNASTIDGYNPYRITRDGIDWEIEEEDDPWSFIGYWGDHQIIYLLKLLELSQAHYPEQLQSFLDQPLFSYANVPYHIKPHETILSNPKDTLIYRADLEQQIAEKVERLGADGKLLLDNNDNVIKVSLLEKLLVPLLAKLSNFVVDGGIWLNTQRPEWNDANNALVGNGLSMVTLYYMRRYIDFIAQLLSDRSTAFTVKSEVAQWLEQTIDALAMIDVNNIDGLSDAQRFACLDALGKAASTHRDQVYSAQGFSADSSVSVERINALLSTSQALIDRSIAANEKEDGLYHAYNILDIDASTLQVEHLYTMLEGQVAALSSGSLSAEKALAVLKTLYASDLYCDNRKSFILYPDRKLPGFLDKGCIDASDIESIAVLKHMLEAEDSRVIRLDLNGRYRFNEQLVSKGQLIAALEDAENDYATMKADKQNVLSLYETIYQHKQFTGRSGTMFGFEGLGSIYWHMVSKLLLAVQEIYFTALDKGDDEHLLKQLGEMYYRVRDGIGFNKTPSEYGAFPTDPYSHTPKHAGAQQPGMTGQVKEEVLTRFAELGVHVADGCLRLDPRLLRAQEFIGSPSSYTYLDNDQDWQKIELPANALAFTYCQVPIVYELTDGEAVLSYEDEQSDMHRIDGHEFDLALSQSIFERQGQVKKIHCKVSRERLF